MIPGKPAVRRLAAALDDGLVLPVPPELICLHRSVLRCGSGVKFRPEVESLP